MAIADIDTTVLRSLVAIATNGSFSRAAERLNCSPATVSVRIKNLEEKLGLQLFNRGTHSSSLTPAGEEILARVKTMLDMHDEIARWSEKKIVSGTVSIGMADNYVGRSLPQLLQNITRQYPSIEINFVCNSSRNLKRHLELRNIDLAIVTTPEEQPSGATLARRELRWAASPTFVMPKSNVLPLAAYPDGCVFRHQVLKQLEQYDIDYRFAFTSTHGEAIRAAVRSGMAVTVMAEETLPAGLQQLDADIRLPHPGGVEIRLLERDLIQTTVVGAVKKEIVNFYRL